MKAQEILNEIKYMQANVDSPDDFIRRMLQLELDDAELRGRMQGNNEAFRSYSKITKTVFSEEKQDKI